MAIYKVDGRAPQVGAAAFVADNATLAGDVTLAEESSVWYGAVLRADTGRITASLAGCTYIRCSWDRSTMDVSVSPAIRGPSGPSTACT